MDGLADVGRIAAHFHRETDFTDQIASVGADDPPAGSGAMRDISVVMRPLCRPSAFLCECQLPFVLSTPATAPTTPAERELPLANAVVQALQISLMGGPLTRQRGGTKDLEAYQLYLRGLDAEWENTRSSLTAARDYFDQAIHHDSRFGLAWDELARDTVLMTNNGTILGPVGYELSRQQAKHALQLSPDLAEAHAMLGYISRVQDLDWAASEAELRRALELDPTNPTALMFAAQLSRALGRFDEAERQVRTALARDPLFTIAIYTLGTIQYNTRRFQEAEATFRRLLALAPNFLWTRTYLAKTLLAEGQADAALAVVLQERDELNRLRLLPTLLQAVNRRSEADDALTTLITRFGDTEAYFVAMNYAFGGEKDRALEWLERAHTEKATELAQLVGERLFDNLASDPRYKAFLRKMNLPEDGRAKFSLRVGD